MSHKPTKITFTKRKWNTLCNHRSGYGCYYWRLVKFTVHCSFSTLNWWAYFLYALFAPTNISRGVIGKSIIWRTLFAVSCSSSVTACAWKATWAEVITVFHYLSQGSARPTISEIFLRRKSDLYLGQSRCDIGKWIESVHCGRKGRPCSYCVCNVAICSAKGECNRETAACIYKRREFTVNGLYGADHQRFSTIDAATVNVEWKAAVVRCWQWSSIWQCVMLVLLSNYTTNYLRHCCTFTHIFQLLV